MPYNPARSDLMVFTLNNGAVMQADPWKNRLDLVEKVADSQTSPAKSTSNLADTSWQLVQFQGGDGKVLEPGDRAQYTLSFNADNTVNIKIDCNRGRSTWKSAEPNQLLFGPIALTRALCPSTPLNNRLPRDLGFVRSYVIKDRHLFLSLFADGGIYEFEPMGPMPAAPSTPGNSNLKSTFER
ncbi:MAG: META domain-containing protein [Oscillatoriales cyanobacterium C42_A2020_001]|nr:META domain-containing protein [Leptolyngbyaceae cyanobacterium C42_A2020_001]